jgi:FKBP-type peptidyl-prolyl cis-trans isomerase SlpA
MSAAEERAAPGSHVTLHYRLALAGGPDVVSTFGARPATFQLGAGQLAPPLEACLVGLAPGERTRTELDAEAFGARRSELVQRVRRSDIPEDVTVAAGGTLELQSPEGLPITARVVAVDEAGVTLDFNHPLAGHALVFEAELIAVL